MVSSLDREIDLKHYLRMLWRRRGIGVIATVTVFAAALISLSIMRPEFDSSITLLIDDRTPLASDVEQVMGGMRVQTSGRYGFEEQRLGKLVGRVRSRPFLERVIRILRMQEDPTVIAEAEKQRQRHPDVSQEEIAIRILVHGLQSHMQFRSVGPGIYQITVTDFSPQNAQTLAQWIGELFVDITRQNELDKIRSARNFGAEQLKLYEDQLRRSESALEQYKGSMIQQDLTSNTVHSENVTMAEALRQRQHEQLETARARVNPLEREVQRMGLEPSEPALWTDLETRDLVRRMKAALQGGVSERLALTFAGQVPPWPPQGTYDVLRRDLLRHLEERAASMHPEAEKRAREVLARYAFARLDAEIQHDAEQALDQTIQGYRRRAQAGPVDEIELSRLEAEVKKDRQLLESFRAQMVAGDVSQAVENTKLGMQVEILDPAQVPLNPSRPNRRKILLASLLLGPLLGAGLAFLAEAADSTLRSLEDFRRQFPEPILCTTPLLASRVAPKQGLRRHWVPAALLLIALLTVGFFIAREPLLRSLDAFAEPVHIVNPKGVEGP